MSDNATNEGAFEPKPTYSAFVLGVLLLAYILNFVDRQVLALVQDDVKLEFGITDSDLGWLATAFAAFYTIAGLPIARLADVWSRKGVLAVCLTAWSAMTVVSGATTSYLQMVVARFGVAVGEAGGTPPSHSLISDYFPPERRATALAIYGWGIFFGTGFGFVFGGMIVEAFDWRTAFYAAGALGIPVALLLMATVKEPPHGSSEGRTDTAAPSIGDILRRLTRTPSFVTLMLAALCQAFLGYTVLTWGVSFLRRTFEMSPAEAGFQFGVTAAIAGAIGITLGGFLADRFATKDARWYGWLSAISSAAALPFALGFAWAPSPVASIASFAIFYLLNNVYVSSLWTLVQNLVPPRMRATASATQLAILNIVGMGGGPLVAGYVSEAYGLRVALTVAALVGASAAAFFILCARTLPRDLANVLSGEETP